MEKEGDLRSGKLIRKDEEVGSSSVSPFLNELKRFRITEEVNVSSLKCIEVFNSMFPDEETETSKSAANLLSALHMLEKPVSFNIAYLDGKVHFFFMTDRKQTIAVDNAVFSSYLHSETKRLYEVKGEDYDPEVAQIEKTILNSKIRYIYQLYPIIENIAFQYLVVDDFAEMDPLANLANTVFNQRKQDGDSDGKGRDAIIQITFKGIPDIAWRSEIEKFEQKKAKDPFNAGLARFLLPGLFGYDSMGKANLPPTIQKDLANISYKKNSIAFTVGLTVAAETESLAQDLADVLSVVAATNYFKVDKNSAKANILDIDKHITSSYSKRIIMTREELASLVHLPTKKVHTPTMNTTAVRVLTTPSAQEGIKICDAYLRGKDYPVFVTEEDLATHYTVLGSTGTGKTTFVEDMADAFLREGYGFTVVDPQDARLIKRVVALINSKYPERKQDIIWFNPFNTEKVITLNPLNPWDGFKPQSLSGLLTNSFYRVWRTSWGPRLEWLLHMAILATTSLNSEKQKEMKAKREENEYKEEGESNDLVDNFYTLRNIFYLYLNDDNFNEVSNDLLHYPNLAEVQKDLKEAIDFLKKGRQWTDVVSPILNKLGIFNLNEGIRNAINSSESSMDLREVVKGVKDETGKIRNKILLVDLKTKEAKDIVRVIGNILISLIYQALQETVSERKGIYGLLIDEGHNFAGEAMTNMIQEGRQIGVSITVISQFIESFMTDSSDETKAIKEAFLSVPRNFIQFGTNKVTRDVLEKFGEHEFDPSDFNRLPKFLAYAILSVHGRPEGPLVLHVKPLSKLNEVEKIAEEDFLNDTYHVSVDELIKKRNEREATKEREKQVQILRNMGNIIALLKRKEQQAESINSPDTAKCIATIRDCMINGYLFFDIYTWHSVSEIIGDMSLSGNILPDEDDKTLLEYIEKEGPTPIGAMTTLKKYIPGQMKTYSFASPALWAKLQTTLVRSITFSNGNKNTPLKPEIDKAFGELEKIYTFEQRMRQSALQNKYGAPNKQLEQLSSKMIDIVEEDGTKQKNRR